MIQFEWDPDKATRNERRHGISFTEASTVFEDPLAITIEDSDHSFGEFRFLTIGYTHERRLTVVAHADRDELAIRIISARRATANERKEYES